jgi:hypothetical protein
MRGCAARAAELHGVPDPQVSLFSLYSLYISILLILIDRASRPLDWLVDGPVLFDWTTPPVPLLYSWIRDKGW